MPNLRRTDRSSKAMTTHRRTSSLMPCALAAAVIALAGCSSLGLWGDEKLTPEEFSLLVGSARCAVVNAKIPLSKLSKDDRETVKSKEPIFDVKYTGHKKGVYSLTWFFGDKRSVRVTGDGDMRDFKDSFKMLVLNSDPPPNSKY